MSVILDSRFSSLTPSVCNANTTLQQYFPALSANNLVGSSLLGTPNSTNATGALWIPTGRAFDGRKMKVRLAGTATAGSTASSTTVNVSIFAVTGFLSTTQGGNPNATQPTYTKIATTGAIQLNPILNGLVPYWIEVDAAGDTASGLLQGVYTAIFNNLKENTPPTALTNAISGLDYQNGNSLLGRGVVFGLAAGVAFSANGLGTANCSAALTQFDVTL
jgi:hypothetical protein